MWWFFGKSSYPGDPTFPHKLQSVSTLQQLFVFYSDRIPLIGLNHSDMSFHFTLLFIDCSLFFVCQLISQNCILQASLKQNRKNKTMCFLQMKILILRLKYCAPGERAILSFINKIISLVKWNQLLSMQSGTCNLSV